MRSVDVQLLIDGLHLKDDESVEDVIQHIRSKYDIAYEVLYEILYEEEFE